MKKKAEFELFSIKMCQGEKKDYGSIGQIKSKQIKFIHMLVWSLEIISNIKNFNKGSLKRMAFSKYDGLGIERILHFQRKKTCQMAI
jgi:hypothetical protein